MCSGHVLLRWMLANGSYANARANVAPRRQVQGHILLRRTPANLDEVTGSRQTRKCVRNFGRVELVVELCAVATLHRQRRVTDLGKVPGRCAVESAADDAVDRKRDLALHRVRKIALQREPVLMSRIIGVALRVERE